GSDEIPVPARKFASPLAGPSGSSRAKTSRTSDNRSVGPRARRIPRTPAGVRLAAPAQVPGPAVAARVAPGAHSGQHDADGHQPVRVVRVRLRCESDVAWLADARGARSMVQRHDPRDIGLP